MSKKNKIIVIMTVYNGYNYIELSIDSLIRQSFRDWKLIIIDNASTDKTPEALKNFSKESRIINERLTETIPRTEALNYALSLVPNETDYIMILDSDDIIEADWLEKALKFLDYRSHVGVLGGWVNVINQEGKKINSIQAPIFPLTINETFSYTFPIAHSSTIFRKNIIDMIDGPYDKNILIGQDWDLCIKLAQITDICTIGHFSVKWRRYEGSVTGKTDNFLQSRFDKLKNLKNGEKCIKSVFSYFKNRNRQGVENLAISLIYIKKKMYSKFLIFFVKSILKSPFAIIINNNFYKLFGFSKPFYKSK